MFADLALPVIGRSWRIYRLEAALTRAQRPSERFSLFHRGDPRVEYTQETLPSFVVDEYSRRKFIN